MNYSFEGEALSLTGIVEPDNTRWEYIHRVSRTYTVDYETITWLNDNGKIGFRLLSAYAVPASGSGQPTHFYIMGRPAESSQLLQEMSDDGKKLKSGWVAMEKAKSALNAWQEELRRKEVALNASFKEMVERHEAAFREREERIEKIRQGLIDEGDKKIDARGIELLKKMEPKPAGVDIASVGLGDGSLVSRWGQGIGRVANPQSGTNLPAIIGPLSILASSVARIIGYHG